MSLRKAINEMCTHCIYDKKGEGGKLQQVAACTAKECPLFRFRPKPKTDRIEMLPRKAANKQ